MPFNNIDSIILKYIYIERRLKGNESVFPRLIIFLVIH